MIIAAIKEKFTIFYILCELDLMFKVICLSFCVTEETELKNFIMDNVVDKEKSIANVEEKDLKTMSRQELKVRDWIFSFLGLPILH